jgi:Rad3-related DNA helicase
MAIGKSPTNYAIKATFSNSGLEKFQDGVAHALQSIAACVPDGMLVFLPSYGMMDKLMTRWKASGTFPVCLRMATDCVASVPARRLSYAGKLSTRESSAAVVQSTRHVYCCAAPWPIKSSAKLAVRQ